MTTSAQDKIQGLTSQQALTQLQQGGPNELATAQPQKFMANRLAGRFRAYDPAIDRVRQHLSDVGRLARSLGGSDFCYGDDS